MSALFDFPSLLVMLLLVICSTTFARSLRPEIFNDSKNVTYNDMLSNMQITDHDLKSHLIPLCKFKILDKSPKE